MFRRRKSFLYRIDQAGQLNCSGLYIYNFGGSRSVSLNRIVLDIARWCEEREITLQADHLPGIFNGVADQESRVRKDWSDWMLKKEVFQLIRKRW